MHPVTVIWVMGHPKMIDVQRGRTRLIDKNGNDGADALAVAGAELHAVDADIVLTINLRKEYAKNVHIMFIEIVQARQVQEHLLHHSHQDVVGDRGSDPGDYMTEANDAAWVPFRRCGLMGLVKTTRTSVSVVLALGFSTPQVIP